MLERCEDSRRVGALVALVLVLLEAFVVLLVVLLVALLLVLLEAFVVLLVAVLVVLLVVLVGSGIGSGVGNVVTRQQRCRDLYVALFLIN